MLRVPLAGLLVCLVINSAQSADPPKFKGPDIGVDYRSALNEHMKFISDGKGGKAIDVLVRLTRTNDAFTEDAKEKLMKRYALVYGAGGVYLGHELVGYKQLSSRFLRFYSITQYEKLAIVHVYTFLKGSDDVWRLTNYSSMDGVDELDKSVPFVPFESVP